MIRLDIEGYCMDCLDFTPDVIKPKRERLDNGEVIQTNTTVYCTHSNRCAAIRRYLERMLKTEKGAAV